MRERRRRRSQCRAPAVERELGPARDAARVRLRVDAARLEGGDLRKVEDIDDVEAVTRDLDAAEAVDREVAERVSRRRDRDDERRERSQDDDQALHAYLLARGAHSTEKCGFRRSARRNHPCDATRLPRQRSIIPRWNSLSASWVPSRSARCENCRASPQRPFRSSAHARTSSPSIDGRSRCARRASPSDARSRIPWSTSNSAVSRSVLTPFATSSRSMTPISPYCLRACAGRPLTR